MTATQPPPGLDPPPGYAPAVGLWLAALQDARRRTLRDVDGLPDAALDAPPPVGRNTIGMLLYHIAGAEMQWIFGNWRDEPFPPAVAALLPVPVWDDDGLGLLRDQPLSSYLARLASTREQLLAAFAGVTDEELRRPVARTGFFGPYELVPERMLFHLTQHEAEHRGHIHLIREAVAPATPAGPPGK